MPQHRETASSISVGDLLRECAAGRSTRHRAEPRTSDRVKLAASAAVAAGTLVGAAAQLAHAAPVTPDDHKVNSADDIVLKSAAPAAETLEQAAPARRVPLEYVATTPQPTPVATPTAPFGLRNLPPDVAGPLAHAEQVIKGLRLPAPYLANKGVVLQARSWGSGR